jgi:hypothetical protein
MPNIGWFDTVETADDYFETERLETSAWDALDNVSGKTKALNMAYTRIYYCGLFEVPDYASATADELVILQKAQAEMAYYLAMHLADEDRRKGIQAQGVSAAGIVKETYGTTSDISVLDKIPIPPIVAGLLEEFSTEGKNLYVSAVDRDEDEEDMEL